MTFKQLELQYARDALEPYISKEVIHYHFDKHTTKYFEKANELAKGTVYQDKPIEEVISRNSVMKMDTVLFNNISQAYNHQFYFKCLAPEDKVGVPSKELADAIAVAFDSMAKFKEEFIDKATKFFGSGWIWLVYKDGQVTLKTTPNANSPLTEANTTPLLVCDLWEHAYYLDSPADRPAYLKAFWHVINWNFVNENFKKATNQG